jgi:hypothetical protein
MPYLTQADYGVLILAMQERVNTLAAIVAASAATLVLFSDIQAEFQAALGGSAVSVYNTLIAKLETLQPSAPTS